MIHFSLCLLSQFVPRKTDSDRLNTHFIIHKEGTKNGGKTFGVSKEILFVLSEVFWFVM